MFVGVGGCTTGRGKAMKKVGQRQAGTPRTKFRGKLQHHARSHGRLWCLRLSSLCLSFSFFFIFLSFPRALGYTRTRRVSTMVYLSLSPGRKGAKGERESTVGGLTDWSPFSRLHSGLPSFIFPTDSSLVIRSVPLLGPRLGPSLARVRVLVYYTRRREQE